MFTPYRTPLPLLSTVVVALGLVLAGCSAPAATGANLGSVNESTDQAPGHGEIEGATEMTEPQLRLAIVSADGSIAGVDLLTGDQVELPDLPAPPTQVTTDGRYLFATSEDGLTIVDSGVWTVPHGDHSHYYLAGARLVGELGGSAGMRTSSAPSLVTVLDPAARAATVLDGTQLGLGAVEAIAEISDVPTDGLLVPLGDHLIQTTAGVPGTAPDTVRVLNSAGTPVSGVQMACPGAAGTITSRVGVVIGCVDGAVLAAPDSADSAEVSLVHIPYPETVLGQDRAQRFAARKDRPVVAAVAGERGAWILDTRKRQWSLIPTSNPLVAVTAVDDNDHAVVAVDRAGRILVLNAETGAVTGSTEPLLAASTADPTLSRSVVIEVDSARAYVNDPAGRRVLEIDHGDGGRISREFPTAEMPMFLAAVGR